MARHEPVPDVPVSGDVHMKNTIVLPSLFIGLVLAGCTRSSTDSTKLASNDPYYGTQKTTDADKKAADKAALALSQTDATDKTQSSTTVAVTTTPAPAANATNDAATTIASSSTAYPAGAPTTTSSTVANSGSTSTVVGITATTPASSATSMTPSSTTAGSSSSAANPSAIATMDVASTTGDTKSVTDRITEWKLAPEDIKSELATGGQIVRSKTVGAGEPTGPMDPVLVTQINAKFAADTELSSLKLKVAADSGVVTLSGSAHSADQIGRAVAVALDTGGVKQAISQIKLDTAPQP